MMMAARWIVNDNNNNNHPPDEKMLPFKAGRLFLHLSLSNFPMNFFLFAFSNSQDDLLTISYLIVSGYGFFPCKMNYFCAKLRCHSKHTILFK